MDVYLNSFGAKAFVKNGMIAVHYDGQTQEFSIDKIEAIMVTHSCHITADLLFAAVSNHISVILLTKSGEPSGHVWSIQYGFTDQISRKQIQFKEDTQSLQWIISIIHKKMENHKTAVLLLEHLTTDEQLETFQKKISVQQQKLSAIQAPSSKPTKDQIRSLEARAGKLYFQFIGNHLPSSYRFERRSRRPAQDPFNSLLNYGYGIMYSMVERSLLKAGLQPYWGVLHAGGHNQAALVYDVIEIFRLWVEAPIIELCRQEVIFDEFFESKDKGLWLNELGKKVLIHALSDFWEESINWEGTQASRRAHINKYAQRLAKAIQHNRVKEDLCSS